jgi:hypothetical protein
MHKRHGILAVFTATVALCLASQAEAAKANKHKKSGAAVQSTGYRQNSAANRGTTFQGGVFPPGLSAPFATLLAVASPPPAVALVVEVALPPAPEPLTAHLYRLVTNGVRASATANSRCSIILARSSLILAGP